MNTESNILLANANNAGGSADSGPDPISQFTNSIAGAQTWSQTPADRACSIAASLPSGMRGPRLTTTQK
jgi:hypothetical protein